MASQSHPVEVRLPNKIKELSSVEYCVWTRDPWTLRIAFNRADDRADAQRDEVSEALIRKGPFSLDREASKVTDYIYVLQFEYQRE